MTMRNPITSGQVPDYLAIERALRAGTPLSPRGFRQETNGVMIPGYLEFVVDRITPVLSGEVPEFAAFDLVDLRQAYRASFLVENGTNTVIPFRLMGSPVGGAAGRSSRLFGLSPIFSVSAREAKLVPVNLDNLFVPWATIRAQDTSTGNRIAYGTTTQYSSGSVSLTAFLQLRT